MGVGVEEFWALTPAETFAVLEAGVWRMEQEQRGRGWLAWHVAALSRAKKLPSLKRLMGGGKTRVLSGTELEKRKGEHEAMVESFTAQRGFQPRKTQNTRKGEGDSSPLSTGVRNDRGGSG